MNDNDENRLIAEVSGELVKRLAPSEVPMFNLMAEAYLKNPESIIKQNKKKDEMLGFGAKETVELFSPLILIILKEVVNYLTAAVRSAFKDETASDAFTKIKNLFHSSYQQKEDNPQETIKLSAQQLESIHQIAADTSLRLNVSPQKASLIADSIIGLLVVKGI